ncbi:hypothetical protein [Sphingobium abikonense]|uniref:hypothetical protein n=1 Tax=Sphingobium abikonense TaxID=86193 RepID=UPI0035145F26
MMIRVMAAVAALAGATRAIAAPTYLECHLTQETGLLPVQIALDEANQKVTIGLPSGRTVTRDGLFGPNEIKVVDDQMTWTIDRVSSSIRRTFAFMPADDPGERGKCKIAPVPENRAF